MPCTGHGARGPHVRGTAVFEKRERKEVAPENLQQKSRTRGCLHARVRPMIFIAVRV